MYENVNKLYECCTVFVFKIIFIIYDCIIIFIYIFRIIFSKYNFASKFKAYEYRSLKTSTLIKPFLHETRLREVNAFSQ